MEYIEKNIQNELGISQQAVSNALKHTPYQLKKVEGSAKPVKHYKYDDLPQRYKDKLEPPKKNETTPHTSKANFTKKYLLATPDKQRAAVLRCRLIEFYLKKTYELSAARWLDEVIAKDIQFDEIQPISQKQLFDWLKKYKLAKKGKTNVVEALLDKRGAAKGMGVRSLSDDMKKIAEAYFIKDTFKSITEVHLNMKEIYGELLPSYDVLNKYYHEWRVKNPVLDVFSQSPDKAKNKYMPAVGNMSEKATHRNHYWELDSTPADIICEDGKRYAVMAAIDIYSRRAVFHVAESSNSYSIAALLRKAILTLGIPQNVVIDNGKDYTSNHFMSICYSLGINPVIVPPFSGDKKPHVERLFGRLSRELFMQVAGFVGANVAQRTQIQARQSFAHKINSIERWKAELKAKSDDEKRLIRDAWKIKKENIGLELNVLKTAEQLQDLIDKWTKKLYEQRVHKGISKKPIDKWNKCPVPVESIPDPMMLNLLLGESVTRRVGKKGIAYEGNNYWHDDLIEHLGKTVFLQVPDDMGYIFVHDEDMHFICIAEDPTVNGKSRAMAKSAQNKWNALTRHLDKMLKEAKNIANVTIETRIEKAKELVHSQTIATTKKTDVIEATIKNIPIIEQKDQEALDKSNRYDFKQKDKEGKPTKVLESGRPAFFANRVERFVWVIENDAWTDKDFELKEKYPKTYEAALRQVKIS